MGLKQGRDKKKTQDYPLHLLCTFADVHGGQSSFILSSQPYTLLLQVQYSYIILTITWAILQALQPTKLHVQLNIGKVGSMVCKLAPIKTVTIVGNKA